MQSSNGYSNAVQITSLALFAFITLVFDVRVGLSESSGEV